MLIVCPACASAYEIDAERVGAAGRSVRCAACRETWFITPDDVAAAEPVVDFEALGMNAFTAAGNAFAAEPERDASDAVIEQPIPSRKPPVKAKMPSRFAMPTFGMSRLPAFSPVLAVGIVAFAMLPMGLLGRGTIVRAVPQTAGLFAAIGLPVNVRGVDFRDVAAFQNAAEGEKPAELIVEGDLVGVSRTRVNVAEIAIEIRDDHGATLRSWTVAPPRPTLDGSEMARFRASLPAPPERGRDVRVSFADAKGNATEAHAAGKLPEPALRQAASPSGSGHDAHAH